MAKSSIVLQTLGILGPEEMLNLSGLLKEKQVPLKKVAGDEFVLWDEVLPETSQKPTPEAKVLTFPKKSIREFSEYREPPPPEPESEEEEEEAKGKGPKLLPSELVLWQREISKQTDATIHKLDAMKGYQKSTQMYVVKTREPEGKTKLRFASTNGVLVNKKQA